MQICFGRFHEDQTLPYLPFVEGLLPRLEAMPGYVRQSIEADIRTISQLHRVGRADQDPARPSQSALSRPPASYPSSAAKADYDRVQLFVSISRAIVTLAERSRRCWSWMISTGPIDCRWTCSITWCSPWPTWWRATRFPSSSLAAIDRWGRRTGSRA